MLHLLWRNSFASLMCTYPIGALLTYFMMSPRTVHKSSRLTLHFNLVPVEGADHDQPWGPTKLAEQKGDPAGKPPGWKWLSPEPASTEGGGSVLLLVCTRLSLKACCAGADQLRDNAE